MCPAVDCEAYQPIHVLLPVRKGRGRFLRVLRVLRPFIELGVFLAVLRYVGFRWWTASLPPIVVGTLLALRAWLSPLPMPADELIESFLKGRS